MGLRLEALKKFFMTDRMLARSSGRKVRRNQRDESKLVKDLAKIAQAREVGLTDVLSEAFIQYVEHAEKELLLLDDALNNLFLVKKRNVERIQSSIAKQKDPQRKKQLESELTKMKKHLDAWFTILQGNARGGRIQLATMGESTLAQEIISISKVYARRTGRLKREENKASKNISDKVMQRLSSDLDDAENLEDKEFKDIENLTLLQEQMEMTQMAEILQRLRQEDYPSEDLKKLEAKRLELANSLKLIFDNQVKRLNTLIRVS